MHCAVLFGPLTALEVRSLRSEGAFVVVELQPTTSFAPQLSDLQLEGEARLEDLVLTFCTEEGVAAITKLREMHNVDEAMSVDLLQDEYYSSKREQTLSHNSLNAAHLARANNIRQLLVSEATAMAAKEAQAKLRELDELAKGVETLPIEFQSLHLAAQQRLKRWLSDETRLKAQEAVDRLALKQAVDLEQSRTWKRVVGKVARQNTKDRILKAMRRGGAILGSGAQPKAESEV